jgi:Secretion system C-terminal sorting domain
MKTVLFSCILIIQCGLQPLFAQTINPPYLFASASARAQSNTFGTLDWSIGETLVATYQPGNGPQLTQGFHQVFISIATPIEDTESVDFQINIFPNPTTGWVNIESENRVKVRIFDIAGKELIHTADYALNPTLDLNTLTSGLFIIEISGEDQQKPQVFKLEVIK